MQEPGAHKPRAEVTSADEADLPLTNTLYLPQETHYQASVEQRQYRENNMSKAKITEPGVLRLLAIVSAIIFGTELAIMVVFFRGEDFTTALYQAFLDSFLLTLVSFLK